MTYIIYSNIKFECEYFSHVTNPNTLKFKRAEITCSSSFRSHLHLTKPLVTSGVDRVNVRKLLPPENTLLYEL